MTIPEIFILKLDDEIKNLKVRGKDCWARFDEHFANITLSQIKEYCKENGYYIEIDRCWHGTYDVIISW